MRTVSASLNRRCTFGVKVRSETPPATYSAVVSRETRISASLSERVHFFFCHGARCFLELFRSHLNGVLERTEAWNPFCGLLDDFGNDVAVTLNSDAFALLDCCQELG